MVLFLIIFLETYNSKAFLTFSFKRVVVYLSGVIVFFTLILTTSILRGYGDFEGKSISSAVAYVPKYLNSDIFVDGITDNLELNYNYGISVTAMDMIVKGDLNYQYGSTIIKLLFLPLPRDVFPNKPESIMQLYTKKRDPNVWSSGGSLPVIFAVECFLNFNFLGLFLYFLMWYYIDNAFIYFHRFRDESFLQLSCLFFVITVLFFARGSGLEQYIQYYLFAIPVFILNFILKRIIV